MIINLREIKIKIKLMDDAKHPDAKAQAFLTFIEEHGRSFTISGFTVRKSKFNSGFYVTPPSNKRFQFFIAEKSLWKEIGEAILKAFEMAGIPIIEE